MQGQFMDMKRLHSYLSKQIPSTLQRVSTSQIPLLSLVKKHNQMNQHMQIVVILQDIKNQVLILLCLLQM